MLLLLLLLFILLLMLILPLWLHTPQGQGDERLDGIGDPLWVVLEGRSLYDVRYCVDRPLLLLLLLLYVDAADDGIRSTKRRAHVACA